MTEMLEALELSAQDYRDASRMTEPEKPYEWFVAPGGAVRAKCLPCGQTMGWAMEIRPEYGPTINKHTVNNDIYQVVYNGKPVQVWKCGDCKQSVVK